MKLQNIISLVGLGLSIAVVGCGSGAAPATKTPGGSAASHAVEVVEEAENAVDLSVPNLDTVSQRSIARWESVVAGDWIQAYDFNDPRGKAVESIGNFLQGKEHHEFRNPSEPKLIGSEGDLAYTELAVLWEPHHPIIQTVRDKPEDMTQELHMVETWRWVEGDWYFVMNQRQGEFHEAHPEIREKQKAEAAEKKE